MRIFLIRHGDKQKERVIHPVLQHLDPSLSQIGESQAKSLVSFFSEISFSMILVSEYRRTLQTAAPLSVARDIPATVDSRLNEIDSGVTEEMTDEEVRLKYPGFWRDYTIRDRDFRIPGGEAGNEVKERQDSLLSDLIIRNENAILVTHEGYIRAMLCNILGIPVYKRHLFACDLCSISEIEYLPLTNEWKMQRCNYTQLR